MSSSSSATAVACANIALIKYWGNRDNDLHLPSNGSISMNLDGLFVRTTVTFRSFLQSDALTINNREVTGIGLERVSSSLDLVRGMAKIGERAEVVSEINFPTDAGIASSAAAFAALALAASKAAELDLSERELSRLARRGSGSACRSVPGGFVEWKMGTGDEDSVAESIAPPKHWDLADCIAIVSAGQKTTSSMDGHLLAGTSLLQAARVADAPRRLDLCRRAVLARDFDALANIVELDSNMMHAVIMTSTPALHYWEAASLTVMESVQNWRVEGLPVCYTVDAGPNVHVLCQPEVQNEAESRLRSLAGVKDVLTARVGGPARLIE